MNCINNTFSLIVLIQNVINVQEAVKASLDELKGIRFLLDTHILYEICCFGLRNTKEKVCTNAERIYC